MGEIGQAVPKLHPKKGPKHYVLPRNQSHFWGGPPARANLLFFIPFLIVRAGYYDLGAGEDDVERGAGEALDEVDASERADLVASEYLLDWHDNEEPDRASHLENGNGKEVTYR